MGVRNGILRVLQIANYISMADEQEIIDYKNVDVESIEYGAEIARTGSSLEFKFGKKILKGLGDLSDNLVVVYVGNRNDLQNNDIYVVPESTFKAQFAPRT
jgi:hypothetical protein